MTTILIFAGGKSTRMGEDKSNMFGGVKNYDECVKANVTRLLPCVGVTIECICFMVSLA